MKFYQGEVQLKKIVHLLEIELYMLLRCENTNHNSLLCSQGKTVGINMRKWIPDQGAGWQTPHQAVSSRASKNRHWGMHRNLDFSGCCLTPERDLLVKGSKDNVRVGISSLPPGSICRAAATNPSQHCISRAPLPPHNEEKCPRGSLGRHSWLC